MPSGMTRFAMKPTTATMKRETTVDSMPTARPAITPVPAPVFDDSATRSTGLHAV